MVGVQVLPLVFALLGVVTANYGGPFVLFGIPGIKTAQHSALVPLDDTLLRDLYAKSNAVIVFLKNATTRLDEGNFPLLRSILNDDYLYLPQDKLSSDPLDYNANAEVINLVGNGPEQDTELMALYREAVNLNGDGRVLGILASRYDMEATRVKRQVRSTEEPSTTPGTEIESKDHVFKAEGKGMLFTKSSPELIRDKEKVILDVHTTVTVQESAKKEKAPFQLHVNFIEDQKKIKVKFNFDQRASYWYLTSAEIQDLENYERTILLPVVGKQPSAPLNSSFTCSRNLEFRAKNETTEFVLRGGFQVQPWMNGKDKFGDAHDCTGFMTAPILAGIFVTFIIGIAMSIAITAIMDIKPPNRFENKSGKQLSFTVQE